MAYKCNEIKSFKLYYDMWPQIEEMTNEERGRFLTACFEYLINGVDDDFADSDRIVRSLWNLTRGRLDAERQRLQRLRDRIEEVKHEQ